MSTRLPHYGSYVDNLFLQFKRVYLLGDIHNNMSGLLLFLKQEGIVNNNIEADNLDNIKLDKDVLLVFLGDVIGKSKSDFKNINVLWFIMKHKENCHLILGNHEMKFLSRQKRRNGVSNIDILNTLLPLNNKNTTSVLIDVHQRLENFMSYNNSRRLPQRSSKNFLDEAHDVYEKLSVNNNQQQQEDLFIRILIISFLIYHGEFILYFRKHKMYMMHAGLNLKKDMTKLKSTEICNVRSSETAGRWFDDGVFIKDTLFVFAHDTDLCKSSLDGTYEPFLHKTVNTNTFFLCTDTNFYKNNVLTYVVIDPMINQFKHKRNVTLSKTPVGYYRITVFE